MSSLSDPGNPEVTTSTADSTRIQSPVNGVDFPDIQLRAPKEPEQTVVSKDGFPDVFRTPDRRKKSERDAKDPTPVKGSPKREEEPKENEDEKEPQAIDEGSANRSSGSPPSARTSVDPPDREREPAPKAPQGFKETHLSGTGDKSIALSLAESVKPGASKRSDFPLLPSKVALLIIDIQDYLSRPSSAEEEDRNDYLFNTAIPQMTSNAETLLRGFRNLRDDPDRQGLRGCEVVFTYLESLAKDCRDVSLDYKLSGPMLAKLPTFHSAKFLDRVHPSDAGKGDILIPKTSCSVFCSTNLHYVLKNLYIEQLVICGQITDQCVESAVRDAADLGYFVTLVEDACAAYSEESHRKGLQRMKGFSRIINTQQILEELEAAKDESDLWIQVPPNNSVNRIEADGRDDGGSIALPSDPVAVDPEPQLGITPTAAWNASSENTFVAPFLRTLQYAGVKFLRYLAVDACNSIRCKSIPIDHLLRNGDSATLDHSVSIAEVCFAGLSTLGDFMIEVSVDGLSKLF